MSAKVRVGIDVGGTFTDLVAYDEAGRRLVHVKVPSTPPRHIEGIMSALGRLGVSLAEVGLIKHGSTIATNAIIQRTGAATGLLTTRGFRDVLENGRGTKGEPFDLGWDAPEPLVPRFNRIGITERVDYRGEVVTPLDEEDVLAALDVLSVRGVRAIAISYLNAFVNPAHEIRTKELVEERLPDVFVCTSHEVFPEIREFERTSTTVANAYLGPAVDDYLAQMTTRLRAGRHSSGVLVTHSGGGVMTLESARTLPARMCQSGPAAGVVAGSSIGAEAGFGNVITFDMGGTSADFALVHEGKTRINPDWRIEHNIPIRLPAIDLMTIGAGGGSIAWIDAGGSLRVGPRSAGAVPGPACYGRGGTEPTITDAQVVLGRLNPERFLGGEMTIDPALAARAITERVAAPLDMAVPVAASGILRVANANMVNAMRLISIQRGYDPRDFAVVAFGGSGPLHAVDLAREIGTPIVIVPPTPGLTSALGALLVDLRHDFLSPILARRGDYEGEAVRRIYEALRAQAREALARDGVSKEDQIFELFADVRYFGQSSYLTIEISDSTDLDSPDELLDAFEARHLQEFGYVMPREAVDFEVVNARLIGHSAVGGTLAVNGVRPAGEPCIGSRDVYFDEVGDFCKADVYLRERLPSGAALAGPAIVEQTDSTIAIPPGVTGSVDAQGNVLLTLEQRKGRES